MARISELPEIAAINITEDDELIITDEQDAFATKKVTISSLFDIIDRLKNENEEAGVPDNVKIWTGTLAAYNNLATKETDTLYFTEGGGVFLGEDAISSSGIDVSGITARTITQTNSDSSGLIASPIIANAVGSTILTTTFGSALTPGVQFVTSRFGLEVGDTFVFDSITHTVNTIPDNGFVTFTPATVIPPGTEVMFQRDINQLTTLDHTLRLRSSDNASGISIDEAGITFPDNTVQTTAGADVTGIPDNTIPKTNADSTGLISSGLRQTSNPGSGPTIELVSIPGAGIATTDTITGLRTLDTFIAGGITYTVTGFGLSGVTPFIRFTPTSTPPALGSYAFSRISREFFISDQNVRITRTGAAQGVVISPYTGIVFDTEDTGIRFGDGTLQTTAAVSAVAGIPANTIPRVDDAGTGLASSGITITEDDDIFVFNKTLTSPEAIGSSNINLDTTGILIGDRFTINSTEYTIGSIFITFVTVSPSFVEATDAGQVVRIIRNEIDTITVTAHHLNLVDTGDTAGLRMTPADITFPDASVQTTAYDLNSISETIDSDVPLFDRALTANALIGANNIAFDTTGVLSGDKFTLDSQEYIIGNVFGTFAGISPALTTAYFEDDEIDLFRDEVATLTVTGRHLSLTDGTDTLRLDATQALPDDYQEVSWTPTPIDFTATDGTTVFGEFSRIGRAVKVGEKVTVFGTVTVPVNTDTTRVLIEGLPFTPITAFPSLRWVGSYDVPLLPPISGVCHMGVAGGRIEFNRTGDSSGLTYALVSTGSTRSITFSITYLTLD